MGSGRRDRHAQLHAPEDIVAAARLVKKGKVISLALNFDNNGPQGGKTNYPALGRINPLHTMLRTGTDAYSGVLDKRGIRAADDMVVMPLQCGTQWDGLGHVFYENNMWNGYDCREVSSFGAAKCGIEKTKDKMVGRGVFLDVARALGKDCLDDGYGITCEDLDLDREEAENRVQARRLHHRAHRTDGALPQGRQLGRLSRRRRAGFCLRDAGIRRQDRTRGAGQRHLGLRSAAQQYRGRHQPAVALDHHPDHGHDHGRDFLSQRPGRGLRRRRRLRIHVRRAGHPDHRRGRLADQSAGHQIDFGRSEHFLAGNDLRLAFRRRAFGLCAAGLPQGRRVALYRPAITFTALRHRTAGAPS